MQYRTTVQTTINQYTGVTSSRYVVTAHEETIFLRGQDDKVTVSFRAETGEPKVRVRFHVKQGHYGGGYADVLADTTFFIRNARAGTYAFLRYLADLYGQATGEHIDYDTVAKENNA